MITLLLSALALATITVIIHGLGAVAAARDAAKRLLAPTGRRARLALEIILARLVAMLLLLHLAEAIVWAAFLVTIGALPDIETAAYFSLTSYTTVGYGDVVLPAPWRLLGPLEAAVGVLMLGWSTGVLVAIIGPVYRELFPTLAPRSASDSAASRCSGVPPSTFVAQVPHVPFRQENGASTPAASTASRIVCSGRTRTHRPERRNSSVMGASLPRFSRAKRSLRTRPAVPCPSAATRTASINRAGPQT